MSWFWWWRPSQSTALAPDPLGPDDNDMLWTGDDVMQWDSTDDMEW